MKETDKTVERDGLKYNYNLETLSLAMKVQAAICKEVGNHIHLPLQKMAIAGVVRKHRPKGFIINVEIDKANRPLALVREDDRGVKA